MLPHKLSHIEAKVIRAGEHFETLKREISAFLKDDACEVRREFDAEKRCYTFYGKPLKEVPLRIRVITGECLGQLGSALDHLAWQLALLNTDRPNGSTRFPIFINAKVYAKDRGRCIGSLPDTAKTIIDNLQPYRDADPERTALWTLGQLVNRDKHRLPHIAFSAARGLWIGGLPGEDAGGVGITKAGMASMRGRKFSVTFSLAGFEHEQEIGSITFLDPAETDLEVERVTIEIALMLADAPGKQAIYLPYGLPRLAAEVKRIVSLFAPMF